MTCKENNCKQCKEYKCRCADCTCLVEQDNEWFCDEQQDFCKNVENCTEFSE